MYQYHDIAPHALGCRVPCWDGRGRSLDRSV